LEQLKKKSLLVHKEKEKRTTLFSPPYKRRRVLHQVEEPLPAIAKIMVDFLQHQANQPRSLFGSHFLKVQYAYWDSERAYRWREQNKD